MMKTRSILMLLAAAAVLPACSEESTGIEIAVPADNGAFVKFFNFSVGSPGVNFFLGNQKVTAIGVTTCGVLDATNTQLCTTTGAESTNGVAYGSSANGTPGYYSSLPVGQQTFAGKIAATTDKDLAIATLQTSLVAGKFYSLYLSGIYDATAKTTEAFIIEDVLPTIDNTQPVAYVRFVNASSTSSPMTLYVKDRVSLIELPVGGEIAYKAGGAFVAIPAAAYDLSTKLSTGAAGPFTRANVTFNAGRVYTITARGNTAVTTTMSLDNTANR